MTEKPGVKIEEFKTIKGGGTTRRERKIGGWFRNEESGRDGVGSGRHGFLCKQPTLSIVR
jgi:hypothetical protein